MVQYHTDSNNDEGRAVCHPTSVPSKYSLQGWEVECLPQEWDGLS